jgi:hypothetical protein
MKKLAISQERDIDRHLWSWDDYEGIVNREGETNMTNTRLIVLIILAAIVFGVLMGFRAGLTFGSQRAACCRAGIRGLGLLVSFISARRK